MKVKYIGKQIMDFVVKDNFMALTPGKIYNVISIEDRGWYRIADDIGVMEGDGGSSIYPPELFEKV